MFEQWGCVAQRGRISVDMDLKTQTGLAAFYMFLLLCLFYYFAMADTNGCKKIVARKKLS